MIVQQKPTNPFSAKYLAPGFGEFVVPPTRLSNGRSRDQYLCAVADRFREAKLIGQIVGPHGCGKTTLAQAVVARLKEDYGDLRSMTMRKRKSRVVGAAIEIQEICTSMPGIGQTTLLLVDGFETLSWVNRMLLVTNIRLAGMGLLVTSHRSQPGIPVVERLRPSKKHFRTIAASKMGMSTQGISNSIIDDALASSGRDYREALMKLYEFA